jgi:hypothetical protein
LEITIDKGTIKRGKYTFPNTAALVMKVLDVAVRQLEK